MWQSLDIWLKYYVNLIPDSANVLCASFYVYVDYKLAYSTKIHNSITFPRGSYVGEKLILHDKRVIVINWDDKWPQ